ncbi:MAG: sensor histidine kinase [Proteobacteria bacterium]|nr:sensor histidine kinase [Pseudomonadota bacterium]
MKPSDDTEHSSPSPKRPQSSALSILMLAAVLGLVWFAALPSDVFQDGGELLRFPLVIVIALIAVAAWSVRLVTEQKQRVGRVEEERDLFFSLSLDIVSVLSLDGHFERINPALVNILGLKPENVAGMALTDIVHADDAVIARNGLTSLASGRPTKFELRCRCGDGSYRWLNWSANPLPEDRRIYAVAHDVTDRKASEDALRAESAFRKAMEDSVLTGLRAIDLKGRIIYVNRAFCDLVGFAAEELIGQTPPFPYWPERDHELYWDKLRLSLAGKAPPEGMEQRIRRRNGKHLDVRLHVSPLIDANGHQTGWMTAMTDITEQRRARAELQAANDRITTVLEGLDAAVYVAEAASGDLLYSNRAYEAQACFAGNASHMVVPHPELGDYPVDPRKLSARDVPRELFDGELQHPVTAQWFHLRERALRWVDGRVVRLAVATDISALKRAEELNREQEARLARTSRLITMGEMASTLAHELNQPLSAISNYSMGCVNRLKSGNYKHEEILGAMEKASAQAARAGNIVRRVRDFVRKSEPRRALVNIGQVTEDALSIAGIEARRLGARVVMHIPNDLPMVMADRIMIEQILMNLIKNAAESMQNLPLEQRQIHITARLADEAIEVSVADSGCGISPEHREDLFSPFFTTKQDGMGMGLNICRSIIEYHKGRLWVDANPAGGSIFSFTLPQEKSLEPEYDA